VKYTLTTDRVKSQCWPSLPTFRSAATSRMSLNCGSGRTSGRRSERNLLEVVGHHPPARWRHHGEWYSADQCHEYFKAKFLPSRVVDLGDGAVRCRTTTTKLSVKEMHDYLEQMTLLRRPLAPHSACTRGRSMKPADVARTGCLACRLDGNGWVVAKSTTSALTG